MGGILSQRLCISNQHDTHFKYLITNFQLYFNKTEKLKKKNRTKPNKQIKEEVNIYRTVYKTLSF